MARVFVEMGDLETAVAVREAVEQATPARVATWHAHQIPAGCRVLEIGCGCGSDSLALAHRAANLIATDVDPVRAACTHMNLMAFGLGSARAIRMSAHAVKYKHQCGCIGNNNRGTVLVVRAVP